jgi:glutamate transport system substrate-binding protein
MIGGIMPSARPTALILSAVLALAACSTGQAVSRAAGSRSPAEGPLRAKSTLTIAVKIDQPGTGYIENGDPDKRTGLDIDVARYIAGHLGPKPKSIFFVDSTSGSREGLITGVNPASTKVDLVIASYSIDDQRAAIVSFAGPYLIAGQTVLVRKSEAALIDDTSGRALEMSLRNLTVCGVSESTPAQRLIQDLGTPWAKTHLIMQGGYGDCVSKLMDGSVDAVSTDDAVLSGYLRLPQYAGKLYLATHTFSAERYGIGLAKNDTTDRAAINAVLRQMIASGAWATLVRQDLGPAAAPFLADVPAPGP